MREGFVSNIFRVPSFVLLFFLLNLVSYIVSVNDPRNLNTFWAILQLSSCSSRSWTKASYFRTWKIIDSFVTWEVFFRTESLTNMNSSNGWLGVSKSRRFVLHWQPEWFSICTWFHPRSRHWIVNELKSHLYLHFRSSWWLKRSPSQTLLSLTFHLVHPLLHCTQAIMTSHQRTQKPFQHWVSLYHIFLAAEG